MMSGSMKRYGYELILNLYGCDPKVIRSRVALRKYIIQLCRLIKMKRYGPMHIEHFGHGNPHTLGYSLFQYIETSSITGHFSELWNSAYINIFSCKAFDAKKAERFTQKFFRAKKVKKWLILR